MYKPTIIYGDRRSGKTKEAIKLSAETGRYILCLSRDRALSVAEMAHKMGYRIPFPLYYGESFYRAGITSVIVDDALELLERILCEQGYPGIRAMVVTITEDDIPKEVHNAKDSI